MPYPLTPITAFDGLPEPQRDNPATFADWGDAWVAAENDGAQQHNVLAGQVNVMAAAAESAATAADASEAAAAASAAAASNSADAAAASAGATKWISGTNYAQGDVVWSPTDFLTYRAKIAINPSTVDPAVSADWQVQVPVAFAAVEVLIISANTSLTANSKNVVRVSSTVRGASLLLPDATAIAGRNGGYPIKNVGAFAVPLRDQSGALLAIIPGAGGNAWSVCEDFSTSAGQWMVMCPDSKPAQAFAAATAEAITLSAWLHVSAIPGVTDKAIVAWRNGNALRAAVATRNSSTNAVTLGAIVTLFTATTGSDYGAMIHALSSTTGLAAFSNTTSDYRVISFTINTGTNTITPGGTATLTNLPNQPNYEAVQQLDATRVAWLTNIGASATWLNIATYAATPTAAQTSVGAGSSGNLDAGLVHVGGGNLMTVGANGNTLYSTSGNTPSQLSTQSYSGTGQMPIASGTRNLGFAPGTGNRATFVSLGANTSTPRADSVRSFVPTGTTVPVAPTSAAPLPSGPMLNNSASALTVGGNPVVTSVGDPADSNNGYQASVRVMRFFDNQLTEIAYGGIDGLPAGRVGGGRPLRMAAVSGQYCIALGANASEQPQVFTVEVIKG